MEIKVWDFFIRVSSETGEYHRKQNETIFMPFTYSRPFFPEHTYSFF